MENNAQLSSTIIDKIEGIETIKTLTSEKQCLCKIDSLFNIFFNKGLKLSQLTSFQSALKQLTQFIFNVLILWYGAHLIIMGTLSTGQLIKFTILLSYFSTPLENIINLQTKLQSAK